MEETPHSMESNRVSENPRSFRNWAEIDLNALRHNFRVAAEAGRGVIAIIKADGYGHGATEIAKTLESETDLEAFGVATLDEALNLRAAGVSAPVLLLGTVLPDERKAVIENGFWASVSSLQEAVALDQTADGMGKRALIHLAVDTGMGRMGIPEEDFDQDLAVKLAKLIHLDVIGLASHFPSADEDPQFTIDQADRFKKVIKTTWGGGLDPQLIHLANSAGLLGFCDHLKKTNTVRPGLMLFGVSPLPEHQDKLRTVLSLKSRVLLVRDLPAGHGVSYGRTHLNSQQTKVATLGIGYGDGLMRHLSNTDSEILIRGKRWPLLGRVTMDQIMVDVTGANGEITAGDEAVLIGHQGDQCITAGEIAKKAGTIPWEVFTSLTPRVKRIYLK